MKFKFNFELLILYWSFVTYDPPCPVEPAVMPMRTSDSWGALLPHAPQSQCHHCLNATREPWCSVTGKPGTHVKKSPSKICLHIPAPSGGTHCQPLRASRAGVPASIYGVAARESILRILNHPLGSLCG